MKFKRQISNYDLGKYSQELKPRFQELINKLGFELVSLSFIKERNTNYLRLTISHSERLVSLSDCEVVSKEAEKELDVKDLIPFSYVLEIQSPGVENKIVDKDQHEFVLEDLGLTIKS